MGVPGKRKVPKQAETSDGVRGYKFCSDLCARRRASPAGFVIGLQRFGNYYGELVFSIQFRRGSQHEIDF